MTTWRLRAYHRAVDGPAVHRFWAAALAPTWPVLPRCIDALGAGLIAEQDGVPIGFVAVDPAGSLPLILVDPAHQRRGCGSALLENALGTIETPTVRVGSGTAVYIWPGVPLDLPAGVAFFDRHGFVADHDCMDLTQDLTGYLPPDGIYDRARQHGITLARATAAEIDEVYAFEAAEYPQWAQWFDGTGNDILVARGPDGAIAGTLLHSATNPGRYGPMLGPHAGSIGCVGVAPDRHNQGIGSAMVSHASEVLREAGTRVCIIDWAVRDAFYGRVGYQPWRRYRMYHRPL